MDTTVSSTVHLCNLLGQYLLSGSKGKVEYVACNVYVHPT